MYKHVLIQHYLKTIELFNKIEQPTLKEALYYIQKAWSSVSSDTIKNCWRHYDIISSGTEKIRADLGRMNDENNSRIGEIVVALKWFPVDQAQIYEIYVDQAPRSWSYWDWLYSCYWWIIDN